MLSFLFFLHGVPLIIRNLQIGTEADTNLGGLGTFSFTMSFLFKIRD